MLELQVSTDSKFDLQLLEQHIQEANNYVVKCKEQNINFMDVCGERGDLYFLLQACFQR